MIALSERSQARYKRTLKGRLTEARYRKSTAYKIASKRWRLKSKDKMRAHKVLNSAIKSGEIIRGNCIECGKENAEAHHDDYDKPLEVIWLCHFHHYALKHRNAR